MFKVECPGCRAPYQVDERRVPSSGLKMRCPKCTTSFKVDPPGTGAQGGSVLGAALGGGVPKVGGALGGGATAPTAPSATTTTPQRRPGITMMGVAPAPGTPSAAAPTDLPSVAGAVRDKALERDDLPVIADVDRTVPLAGGPPATPFVTAGPLGAAPEMMKAPAASSAVGAGVPKAPPPVPPRRGRPASPSAGAATEIELDLPAAAAPRAPAAAAPRAREATPLDLDLPAIATLPPSAELPDLRGARSTSRSHPEIELDLPSPSADLPARGSARPNAGLGLSGDLPSPAAGLPSPSASLPRLSAAFPLAALSSTPSGSLPTPSGSLPMPSGSLPMPSGSLPTPSASLPARSASLPTPSASLPQRGASLPAALGGLPSARPPREHGILSGQRPALSPEQSLGFSLTPPAIGDLELPMSPPETVPLDAPVMLDEPVREVDPFGEADLPPPRSLRDTEVKSSLPPQAAGGAVVRQEGGGTSYGEVDLGGDSGELSLEGPARALAPAHASEDMEFEAVPQEKGQPRVSDPRKLAPEPRRDGAEPARPRRRTAMKVFAGVCVVLAAGGSLALLPEIGPFGAHWLVDRARSGEYDAMVRESTEHARKLFGADTAPDATRAWNDADRARASARRLKPLSTHTAFVGYLRELRFGTAPEIHARASVLLDEIDPKADVPYYELALAARAATEGQLARARQSLTSLLASERNNIDALVVSGEVELRARNTKTALETWRAVAKLEHSARALFGLARAEYWAGDLKQAEAHAKETLAKNPAHVGARILLARIASAGHVQESSAILSLESITQDGASASSEELVNAYTLLGDVHLSRSRISRAESAYGAALKLEPKAPGALSGLGEALFRAGRYSEAQARFEASAQADPDDLAAKVGVAKSKFMLERLEEAGDSLKKLSEAHPKSVLAAYWYGRVLEAMGERDGAEKSYKTALEQKDEADPMLVESYIALALLENQQGKADAALGTLNSARQRFPSTPAIHRALGDVALTQGRYGEARSEFEQALALDQEDLATRFRLGTALRRDSKFDDAIKVFDQVAAVDAEFPGLALERGLLFEAAGKTEEALKQYEGARAKAPDDPDLLLRVGCGYASAGRTKEAEELLRKVLALRPTSAETQHCLGRALLAEGSRLADALRLLERATELDPHRAEYHLYVGWAANEAGNVAKAQRSLDEAIKLDQGLADAYWQRGVLRSRQGAVKDAIADLTRALALRPTRHEAHAALADAYYDLGREPLALEEWSKAVEAKPDNATWRFRYGKLLAANHRNEPAKVELTRALELSEERPHGERWLWEAHHLLARVLGARTEAVPHWEAFLKLGPLDSPYRAEAKAILERLGRPWTGN